MTYVYFFSDIIKPNGFQPTECQIILHIIVLGDRKTNICTDSYRSITAPV